MMIYLLKEYTDEDFDVSKAMMVLVHGIVEIDEGDTYAYDTKAMETQRDFQKTL